MSRLVFPPFYLLLASYFLLASFVANADGSTPVKLGTFKIEARAVLNEQDKNYWNEEGSYIDYNGPFVFGSYIYLNKAEAVQLPREDEYSYSWRFGGDRSPVYGYKLDYMGGTEASGYVRHSVTTTNVIFNWSTGEKETIHQCGPSAAYPGGWFVDFDVDPENRYLQSGPSELVGRHLIVKGFNWGFNSLYQYAVCIYDRDDGSSYLLTDREGNVFREINSLYAKRNTGANLFYYLDDGYLVYNLQSREWSEGKPFAYPDVENLCGETYNLQYLKLFNSGAGTTFIPGGGCRNSSSVLVDGSAIYDLSLRQEMRLVDSSIEQVNFRHSISFANKLLFTTGSSFNTGPGRGQFYQAEYVRDSRFTIKNGTSLECTGENEGVARVSLDYAPEVYEVIWFVDGQEQANGFEADLPLGLGKHRISFLAKAHDGVLYYSSARIEVTDSIAPVIEIQVRDSKGEIVNFVDKSGMNDLIIDYSVLDACDPDIEVESSVEVMADNYSNVRMQATSGVVSVESNNFRIRVNAEDKFGNTSSAFKVIYAR